MRTNEIGRGAICSGSAKFHYTRHFAKKQLLAAPIFGAQRKQQTAQNLGLPLKRSQPMGLNELRESRQCLISRVPLPELATLGPAYKKLNSYGILLIDMRS